MMKHTITITRSPATGKYGDIIDTAVAVAEAEKLEPVEAVSLMVRESRTFRRFQSSRKKRSPISRN